MRGLLRLTGLAGVLLVLLVLVAVGRTLLLDSSQTDVAAWSPPGFDEAGIVERFRAALRIPTISHENPADLPVAEFERFRDLLSRSYPLMHRRLAREIVAEHTLLYTWRGRDPSADPVLLMGHQDVVPADRPEAWQHPPFAGELVDGVVWGRGAIDDKFHVMATCEAVEFLIARGFEPERTVLLLFGHDEEVGGHDGAAIAAQVLADRGVEPFLVVDEGGAVVREAIPGLEGPMAMIGVAEKGSLNLHLSAGLDGPAHSSTPPNHTPVGRLARAVQRLEADPFPPRISPAVADMMDFLAPELPFAPRVVVGNRWLFGPLLSRGALRTPVTAAMVRTTIAATMMAGSSKANVIPSEATATVNFRVLTGESVAETEQRAKRVIDDDAVEIRRGRHREPSTTSRTDTPGFAVLETTIREVFPEAALVPYLVMGGTDARYLHPLSDSVYRFAGLELGQADLGLSHGVDERLSVENLVRGVGFLLRLIENAAGPAPADAAPSR